MIAVSGLLRCKVTFGYIEARNKRPMRGSCAEITSGISFRGTGASTAIIVSRGSRGSAPANIYVHLKSHKDLTLR